MKATRLRGMFLNLTFQEALDLIKERRASRYQSKKKQRPSHIQRKIDRKKGVINLLESLSQEELKKLLEDLEDGTKKD